ncbi:MAG: hypothetical protein ACRDQU_06330 [Pseudonocardiaceae bacterium]
MTGRTNADQVREAPSLNIRFPLSTAEPEQCHDRPLDAAWPGDMPTGVLGPMPGETP